MGLTLIRDSYKTKVQLKLMNLLSFLRKLLENVEIDDLYSVEDE